MNRIVKFLDIEFRPDNEDDLVVQSSFTLRLIIGILGLILPTGLWFYSRLFTDKGKPIESISHYFYTPAGTFFIIVVSAIAIFLIVYKGPEFIDFVLSSIAGVSALIMLFCPTSNLFCASEFSSEKPFHFLPANEIREWVHYISATLFLGSLAMMSLFLFTISNINKEIRPKRKIYRNRIFRICGIVMLLAMCVIALKLLNNPTYNQFYDKYILTFWMETVCVWAFGISWLVKSGYIIKDKKN